MTTDLEAITCPCFFDGWSQWITSHCPLHDYYQKQQWCGKGNAVWLPLIWVFTRICIVILAAMELSEKFL